jgi:hypothetical protein
MLGVLRLKPASGGVTNEADFASDTCTNYFFWAYGFLRPFLGVRIIESEG